MQLLRVDGRGHIRQACLHRLFHYTCQRAATQVQGTFYTGTKADTHKETMLGLTADDCRDARDLIGSEKPPDRRIFIDLYIQVCACVHIHTQYNQF